MNPVQTDVWNKSEIARAGGLTSVNRSTTIRVQQAMHIGYDAASGHNSETSLLPSTKDLKGTSPPRSVPPTVRRANLMLDTLHTVLGVFEFAAFLRDSIKRVTISGMILSGVALINDAEGFDAIPKTYNSIPLRVRSHSVRRTFIAIFGTETYCPGRRLIGAYV